MTFKFSPPATLELPRTLPNRPDTFWSRVRRPFEGSTVLKLADGTYQTVHTPTQEQIAGASVVYQGGHLFEVTPQEAAALVAAGYEVTES